MIVPFGHVLILAGILFLMGIFCAVVRRNLITVLMSLELIFNAVNLNFVAFSDRLADLGGQIFGVFVITVAAAEAAIGLGLIIALVRLKDTVTLDDASEMGG